MQLIDNLPNEEVANMPNRARFVVKLFIFGVADFVMNEAPPFGLDDFLMNEAPLGTEIRVNVRCWGMFGTTTYAMAKATNVTIILHD